MNNKLILAMMALMSISLHSFSNDYFLYIYTSDEKLKPSFRDNEISNDEALNKIFKDFGVTGYYKSFPNSKSDKLRNCYEIHLKGDIDSLENLLRRERWFERIERSDYYKPATCNNPFAVNDVLIVNHLEARHALNLLNAGCAWAITTGDRNIIVGVVDTEFDTTHIDMESTFAGTVGPQSINVYNHGTAVSSSVAMGTNNGIGLAGIGYNTRVRGFHVYGTTGSSGPAANIWAAVDAAYGDGRKIINVSWTGMASQTNINAINAMVSDGVVFTLAAGNDNLARYHSLYANIPGVINVSGVDSTNRHSGTYGATISQEYHANNAFVDVCALSVRVATCYPTGSGHITGYSTGTSVAAPQVAGVVALMRSVNPGLRPDSIEAILKRTGDLIADADSFPNFANGRVKRVNAYKAVKAAICAPSSTSATPKIYSKTLTAADKYEAIGSNIVNVSNTTVESGAKLAINACSQINITGPFTVQSGASLDVRIISP